MYNIYYKSPYIYVSLIHIYLIEITLNQGALSLYRGQTPLVYILMISQLYKFTLYDQLNFQIENSLFYQKYL